jgi:nucleoporin SEH1
MGQAIGSIGEDHKFNVWQEDPYAPPNSGRRFKCVCTLRSPSRMPFVSLDFKTLGYSDVYVALLARDALLTVYEADEPDSLASWALVHKTAVCAPPPRSDETAFRVEFDPSPLPAWEACRAGAPEHSVALATAAMHTAKVWRSNAERRFYLAADLSAPHRGLVRCVAWAPSNARGCDLLATCCSDGYIRIFELHPEEPASGAAGAAVASGSPAPAAVAAIDMAAGGLSSPPPVYSRSFNDTSAPAAPSMLRSASVQPRPSGIGAGLAAGGGGGGGGGGSNGSSSRLRSATRQSGFSALSSATHRRHERASPNAQQHPLQSSDEGGDEERIPHTVKEIAAIRDHYGGVWEIKWRPVGKTPSLFPISKPNFLIWAHWLQKRENGEVMHEWLG